jgi:hypothetical protein
MGSTRFATVSRRALAVATGAVLAVSLGAVPAAATSAQGSRTCGTGFGGAQLYVFTYNYAAGDDVWHLQVTRPDFSRYASWDFGDNLPPATRYKSFGLKNTPMWIVNGEIQENSRSGAECML